MATRDLRKVFYTAGTEADELNTSFLERHNSHFLTVRENGFRIGVWRDSRIRESAPIDSSLVNFMQVYCDCGTGIMGGLSDRYESGQWSICRVSQKDVATSVRVRSIRVCESALSPSDLYELSGRSGVVIAAWKSGTNGMIFDITGTAVVFGEIPILFWRLWRRSANGSAGCGIPEGDDTLAIEIELMKWDSFRPSLNTAAFMRESRKELR